MLKEFREFIQRGNVMDLAIGVVIGAAFGKIVSSFVDDLLMPLLGLVTGGVDLTERYAVLATKDGAPGTFESLAKAKEAGASVLAYGQFLNTILQFVIISFAIFLMVKAVNRLNRRQEEAPAPAEPPADVALLTEIRDLLRQKA